MFKFLLKRKKWNISKNSRIWKIKSPLANRMNLLVQAPHKDESKEYFTLPQSPYCNEDGRLESNREDQYSHKKLLQDGNRDVIEDLKE
jgi:hypothetical protein